MCGDVVVIPPAPYTVVCPVGHTVRALIARRRLLLDEAQRAHRAQPRGVLEAEVRPELMPRAAVHHQPLDGPPGGHPLALPLGDDQPGARADDQAARRRRDQVPPLRRDQGAHAAVRPAGRGGWQRNDDGGDGFDSEVEGGAGVGNRVEAV